MRFDFRHCALTAGVVLSMLGPLCAEPAPAGGNPWANSPGSREFPNSSAIILKDDIQVVVHEDGSHDLIEYDAVKLLDRNGVDRFGRTSRIYDSRLESIEVPLVRMYKADGGAIDLPASSVTDNADETLEKTALYKSLREVTIDYKGSDVGSVVEYRIIHHIKRPWNGRKFWEISYTQDFEPILDTQFTFTCPERMSVNIATPGMPGLQPETVSHQSGKTVLHWHLTNRPPLDKEAAMPSLRQLASQIQVSNFSNWNDFSTWARSTWDPVCAPDAAITGRAKELVNGVTTEDAKIRKVMAWLYREKSTIDADVGLEDLPPAAAADELGAKELLPGDRANILVAMLRAAGLRAYPVLVASSDYGDPTRGVPSLQQFNRVLVVLSGNGGAYTWLDPTAPAPNLLGGGLNGRPALVLNGGARWVETPRCSADADREEITGVARLDSDGTMETQLRLSEYGANGLLWRSYEEGLKDSDRQDEQERVFKDYVASINQTALLRNFYVPSFDPDHPDAPVEITLDFEMSRGGLKVPGTDGFEFAIPVLPPHGLIKYAELPPDKRHFPIVLSTPTYDEHRIQVVLPDGWKVKSLPHSVLRQNSVGTYQVAMRSDEHSVWYYSRLIIRQTDISLSSYPQFKDLMDQVNATSAEPVVLTMPASSAGPSK